MHLLSPSPLIDLSYRPDLHILVMRWLGTADETEIKRIYRAVEAANEQQCRFWLIDARRRASFNPEITTWLFEKFVPAMAAQLGGPLYFSYLVGPTHLAGAQEFLQGHFLPGGPERPYRLHYAGEEREATDWLLQAREAVSVDGR
ncbi:hypothetical protein [Hymenobacter metallicola]|uniref:STAS/SEC14 domain-containing protein n=1 Tax=Hymenobacter metallicola TaxID=2563114 RepID=A0A4Z0Q169_9BACT|nr:hypothetical protein [Hymenobacter metallicola]TGE23354.1 hypothetical protein E5K02_19355 [Hymenobacter metallicola]